MKTIIKVLIAGLLLAVMAACGQPPAGDPQPDPVAGPVVGGFDTYNEEFVVLAAGLAMIDVDYEDEITLSSITEIGAGFFVGPTVAITPGEPFTVPYPTAAHADTLTAGTSFLYSGSSACTTQSSNPSALVSETVWMLISIPAIVGYGPDGMSLGIATDGPVDLEADAFEALAGRPIVSFIYATAPTTITTPEGGCDPMATVEITVDLELDQGWNQVAFVLHSAEADPTELESVELSNSDLEEVHVTFLGSF